MFVIDKGSLLTIVVFLLLYFFIFAMYSKLSNQIVSCRLMMHLKKDASLAGVSGSKFITYRLLSRL